MLTYFIIGMFVTALNIFAEYFKKVLGGRQHLYSFPNVVQVFVGIALWPAIVFSLMYVTYEWFMRPDKNES